MSRIFVFIFSSLVFPTLWAWAGVGLAQENINCDNAVDEASELYNAGKYDDCIQYLENVFVNCKLSKKKKEQAYELIINSNIEKDNLEATDKGFKNLLANNPAYNLKDYNGLDEFSTYFKEYYVYPKVAIGVRPYY